eukprot:CAMPEP_0171146042 /NCGR_PEP_ID=MMETSP0766_2-20121228/147365_1 /TAXON_ID=439317 /ORGANISM="Gambierdiscus australes, Strain CAWD 149" /LENGTH=172 /DNA_ID=CAMNT_0011609947 /DNA_START=466 /DNA_END=984 /DNA_ORIENTATION=+
MKDRHSQGPVVARLARADDSIEADQVMGHDSLAAASWYWLVRRCKAFSTRAQSAPDSGVAQTLSTLPSWQSVQMMAVLTCGVCLVQQGRGRAWRTPSLNANASKGGFLAVANHPTRSPRQRQGCITLPYVGTGTDHSVDCKAASLQAQNLRSRSCSDMPRSKPNDDRCAPGR